MSVKEVKRRAKSEVGPERDVVLRHASTTYGDDRDPNYGANNRATENSEPRRLRAEGGADNSKKLDVSETDPLAFAKFKVNPPHQQKETRPHQ